MLFSMKVQIIVIFFGVASFALAAPTIDSSILKTFDNKDKANILISFKGSDTASIRNSVRSLKFVDRTQRIQYLHDYLKQHADETQASILNILRDHRAAQSIVVRQLWITNQISIKNADKQLVEEILNLDEVSAVSEEVIVPLEKPIDKIEHPLGYVPAADEQWGLIAIDVLTVWATGNKGSGVVICNIDSGVRGTHEALRDGFRKLHGWYDAQDETPEPVDAYGHGTHTMGTMVGRKNGIGVAPEAEWIACRACTDQCSNLDFLLCGQWALCPTDSQLENPRCDLAPHAISNSWGISWDNDWYDQVMDTWIKADIAPIFSLGNSGTSCYSANSPGDSPLAIGVGATTSTNRLASFSSVGPTASGVTKPDVSAPGNQVYSSYNSNDAAYTTMSGTSMAAPHVGGLTALLYHINSNLTVSQIRDVLAKGAQPVVPTGRTCAGLPDTEYPNNHVGHGVISASASVDILKQMIKEQ